MRLTYRGEISPAVRQIHTCLSHRAVYFRERWGSFYLSTYGTNCTLPIALSCFLDINVWQSCRKKSWISITSSKIKVSESLWIRNQAKAQNTCMDKQGASGKTWREEGSLWKLVEKGAGFLDIREGYRNVLWVCRNVIWKAKVHLELNLAREVKDNNRGSLQYTSSNRKIWENRPTADGDKGSREGG